MSVHSAFHQLQLSHATLLYTYFEQYGSLFFSLLNGNSKLFLVLNFKSLEKLLILASV